MLVRPIRPVVPTRLRSPLPGDATPAATPTFNLPIREGWAGSDTHGRVDWEIASSALAGAPPAGAQPTGSSRTTHAGGRRCGRGSRCPCPARYSGVHSYQLCAAAYRIDARACPHPPVLRQQLRARTCGELMRVHPAVQRACPTHIRWCSTSWAACAFVDRTRSSVAFATVALEYTRRSRRRSGCRSAGRRGHSSVVSTPISRPVAPLALPAAPIPHGSRSFSHTHASTSGCSLATARSPRRGRARLESRARCGCAAQAARHQ